MLDVRHVHQERQPHRAFRSPHSLWPLLPLLLLACLCPGLVTAADEPEPAKPGPPANKLTFSFYEFSSSKRGLDVNLRHSFQSSTAWIAAYHQSDGFDQGRLGYEYDYHSDWLTFVPSVQAATHGFVGATLYGEVGRGGFFGIAGTGRTNLQPYWNLGFDPNDYIQLGGGYRDHAGNTISVYAIHDNRLDTGQTNTHVFFRRHLTDDWRLTVDLVRESGSGDEGLVVRGWALTGDIDWRRLFVRVAADPHVNYTADRQVRIATGLRF
jgi:hypothetical protein